MSLTSSLANLSETDDFQDFVATFATHFSLDPRAVDWHSRIDEDLEFDSLGVIEVLGFLEEQRGCELPDEVAWEIETIGEAYTWFRFGSVDDNVGSSADASDRE